MKTEFVDVSDTRKQLLVEIPSTVVDAEIDRIARDYGKAARIPGFRPGKVPPKVVRTRFRDQILHDVAHDLIPRAVDDALRERGVEPVDTPDIKNVLVEEGQPLKFTAGSSEVVENKAQRMDDAAAHVSIASHARHPSFAAIGTPSISTCDQGAEPFRGALALISMTEVTTMTRTSPSVSNTLPGGRVARDLVARGAVLLDVRTPDEFRSEHVPGALNVPLQELPLRLHDVGPRERPVVVYCRSGKRSAEAARVLRQSGFHHVHDLGAMLEWTAHR